MKKFFIGLNKWNEKILSCLYRYKFDLITKLLKKISYFLGVFFSFLPDLIWSLILIFLLYWVRPITLQYYLLIIPAESLPVYKGLGLICLFFVCFLFVCVFQVSKNLSRLLKFILRFFYGLCSSLLIANFLLLWEALTHDQIFVWTFWGGASIKRKFWETDVLISKSGTYLSDTYGPNVLNVLTLEKIKILIAESANDLEKLIPILDREGLIAQEVGSSWHFWVLQQLNLWEAYSTGNLEQLFSIGTGFLGKVIFITAIQITLYWVFSKLSSNLSFHPKIKDSGYYIPEPEPPIIMINRKQLDFFLSKKDQDGKIVETLPSTIPNLMYGIHKKIEQMEARLVETTQTTQVTQNGLELVQVHADNTAKIVSNLNHGVSKFYKNLRLTREEALDFTNQVNSLETETRNFSSNLDQVLHPVPPAPVPPVPVYQYVPPVANCHLITVRPLRFVPVSDAETMPVSNAETMPVSDAETISAFF